MKELKEEFKLFMAKDVLQCVNVLGLDMNIILVSIPYNYKYYYKYNHVTIICI